MVRKPVTYIGTPRDGAAGASKAFVHERCRRMLELQQLIGIMPFPGTLNLALDRDFDFEAPHIHAEILDRAKRGNKFKPFDDPWEPRPCRLWPMTLDGKPCWAIRFDDNTYKFNFAEIIAAHRLRDGIGPTVRLAHATQKE